MKAVAPARPARTLGALLDVLPDRGETPFPGELPITGITAHSAQVVPGALFVAVAGSTRDGHTFIADALARGAAALLVERLPAAPPVVPVARVPDTRAALARLASAWHGHAHAALSLVGITGTVGKTTLLSMLEAVLLEAGDRLGTIGSLGVRIGRDERRDMGYTAPDPLLLHAALARIAEQGCTRAVMEVTSHALDQRRVHGLQFELGVLTSLLPLEHSEYHASFRKYVEVKRSFLEHLAPGALLVCNDDDFVVRALALPSGLRRVSCGHGRDADVAIESTVIEEDRSAFTLASSRPLPRVAGPPLAPLRLPLRLRTLGRASVKNAALAATAALSLGAPPDAVQSALAGLPAPRRRVQVLHRGRFVVIDDTVGHPDSVSVVLEVAEALAERDVVIACAVRGARGPRINRAIAGAFAAWAPRLRIGALVVTRSIEAADARNAVSDQEYAAFMEPLRGRGLPLIEHERLDDAVRTALDRAGPGSVVLLLGAQGMDDGAAVARAWLAAHPDA